MRRLILALCVVVMLSSGAQAVEAQLMAWAILPRDDEMPPGFTIDPNSGSVTGNGSGVWKIYRGAYGTGWMTSADLGATPVAATRTYVATVADLNRQGLAMYPFVGFAEQAVLGHRDFPGGLTTTGVCFQQGRWVGCVAETHLTGSPASEQHVALLDLMWNRSLAMP
jgi:hypothetical protein